MQSSKTLSHICYNSFDFATCLLYETVFLWMSCSPFWFPDKQFDMDAKLFYCRYKRTDMLCYNRKLFPLMQVLLSYRGILGFWKVSGEIAILA